MMTSMMVKHGLLLGLLALGCSEAVDLSRVSARIGVAQNLDFGDVPLGATKRLALSVQNLGSLTLELTGVDVGAPFVVSMGEGTLGPGGQTTLQVGFRPSQQGPATGTLVIMSNAAENPVTQVSLSGEGVQGFVSVRPEVVDLTNTFVGASPRVEIVVSNADAEPVNGRIEVVGFPRPQHFSLSSLTDFASGGAFGVDALHQLVLDLQYRPIAAGEDSGRMVFETCGVGCGLEVEVLASASDAALKATPPVLDFGAVGIGVQETMRLSVENLGSDPIQLSRVEATGQVFSLTVAGGLPVVLAQGEAAALDVAFQPDSASAFTGEVVIDSDNARVPTTRIRIMGEGRGPLFLVEPQALSFGTERAPGTYARSVVMNNAGSSDVVIRSLEVSGDPAFGLLGSPGLPNRLGPGESLTVRVAFRPDRVAEYLGRLRIHTDDVAKPEVEIPLSGGLADQICALQVTPGQVNFGLIPLGYMREKSVALKNDGEDACLLESGAFRDPVDAAIMALSAPWPVELGPGDSIQLDFRYTPTAMRDSKANFVVRTADPVFPERNLSLVGSARRDLDIFTQPSEVDFGPTRLECSAGSRKLTVHNAGQTATRVQSVTLTSTQTQEFQITRTLSPGTELGRETSTSVEVSYRPVDEGADTSELEIVLEDFPYPLVVPLSGQGALNPQAEDAFEQVRSREIDVLFVIDNSCSMADDQAALAANFNAFIRSAKLRDVDFQIGVTTTTLHPIAGALVGPVLTSKTPNLETAFRQQANVGITGSGIEPGLAAMAGAFSLADSGHQPNASLFRPAAGLVVVIVSDEDDQSRGSPLFYFNVLRNRGASGLLTAMVTGQRAGCNRQNPLSARPAPRYEDFSALSGGLSESICSDWSSTLANIGDAAFGLRGSFRLERAAEPGDPIEVRIDGVLAAMDAWSYDPAIQSIVFQSPPKEGSSIQVRYTPACP